MVDEDRTATEVTLDDCARPADHGDRAAFLAVPVRHDRSVVGAVREADGVPGLREAHGLGKIEAAAGRGHVVGHGRRAEQQVVERARQQREACSTLLVEAGHGAKVVGVRRRAAELLL